MIKIIRACVLILTGLTIRLIAIYQLRGNFSPRVKLPNFIIWTGLYKKIRHPCYLGSIIMIAGIALLCTELAVIISSILFFMDRAQREEDIIATFLKPEDRQSYLNDRGMFLPKIRKKR